MYSRGDAVTLGDSFHTYRATLREGRNEYDAADPSNTFNLLVLVRCTPVVPRTGKVSPLKKPVPNWPPYNKPPA
jgi:hypothetical protein